MNICEQQPFKDCIKKAAHAVVHGAKLFGVENFLHLQSLRDDEIDRMITEKVYFHNNVLYDLPEALILVRAVFDNKEEKDQKDYVTNQILKHYFKPLENCNTMFTLIEPDRVSMYLHEEIVFSVAVPSKKYNQVTALSLENPSTRLARYILRKFLPILNNCPLLEIISVNIEGKNDSHQTYLLIETEQINNSVSRFNIYLYDPNATFEARFLPKFAEFFGQILCDYLNKKELGKTYQFLLHERVLCPIGLQAYGEGNFCVEYSLITVLTTILVWHSLFSRSLGKKGPAFVTPIYHWGQCVEKFYWSVLTRKQLLYLALALRVSLIMFLTAQIEKDTLTLPVRTRQMKRQRMQSREIETEAKIPQTRQRDFSRRYEEFLREKEESLKKRLKLYKTVKKQANLTDEERTEGKKDLIILLNRLKEETKEELTRRYSEQSSIREGIAHVIMRTVHTPDGIKLQTTLAIGRIVGPTFQSENMVEAIDYNVLIDWVVKNLR